MHELQVEPDESEPTPEESEGEEMGGASGDDSSRMSNAFGNEACVAADAREAEAKRGGECGGDGSAARLGCRGEMTTLKKGAPRIEGRRLWPSAQVSTGLA